MPPGFTSADPLSRGVGRNWMSPPIAAKMRIMLATILVTILELEDLCCLLVWAWYLAGALASATCPKASITFAWTFVYTCGPDPAGVGLPIIVILGPRSRVGSSERSVVQT